MSDIWTPHATVACVIESDGKFLLVEEMSHGKRVFNQPAGHIEENERISDAALRETLEESGWKVELLGLIGVYIYTAPQNGVCYHRYCFAASPIAQINSVLDDDIVAAHWLSLREVRDLGDQLRSPLVMKCIEDFLTRKHFPLEIIYEHSTTTEILNHSG